MFGFYGLLMHESAPYVVSLASNADQATIIYNRVKDSIDFNPQLRRRFKTTGTRGITRQDKPGTYKVKPAKADALQGIPVTLCLFDEVHICAPEMWAAMIKGTTAKADGLVLGITTAGDDNSTLLKDLYVQGRAAAAGEGNERFGFFLWEAKPDAAVDDLEALKDANPALASGRLSAAVLLDSVRTMPEDEARRYSLNQFVGSESSWLPMSIWNKQRAGSIPDGAVVFAVDRTPSWEAATITATVKTDTGELHSEVVATFANPTLERLEAHCVALYQHNPIVFVMDGYTLSDLAERLKTKGYPVRVMRLSDVTNACATAYALLATGKAWHKGDNLLGQQMPFAVKKNSGSGWRINRGASDHDIDAVMATVFGYYIAESERPRELQVF